MNQIRLQRHGKPDLLFNGIILAKVDDREFTGFTENWMETSLYKTSLGQYILYSEFNITSCGKRTIPTALVFASDQDLLEFMEVNERPLSCLSAEMLRQASLFDEAFDLCGPRVHVEFLPRIQTAQAS